VHFLKQNLLSTLSTQSSSRIKPMRTVLFFVLALILAVAVAQIERVRAADEEAEVQFWLFDKLAEAFQPKTAAAAAADDKCMCSKLYVPVCYKGECACERARFVSFLLFFYKNETMHSLTVHIASLWLSSNRSFRRQDLR
jgi:hypothetical protein